MPKYKFTEIAINSTEKKKPTEADKDTYIGLEHLDSGTLTVSRWGADVAPIGEKLIMKKGDVLFGKRRAYQKKVGIAPFDGIFSAHGMVLRPRENVITKEYFPLFISSDYFLNEAIRISVGSLSPTVNWKDLKELEFFIPTIEEQRRITPLVWAAIETKNAYKTLISRTDDLVKSQFIEMFGRLGCDEKGWGLTTLGRCCELNPKRPKGIADDTEVSFVPMPAVSEEGHMDCSTIKPYSEVKKGFTYFAEDDVLFAKITPCMENGKGAVAKGLSNGIGAGSTEFHVLRPITGKSNPYWIYTITMFDEFRTGARKVMTGTGGQLRVPINYLSDYPITLPPIKLQDQFEAIVRQSDKSKFELQESIARIDNLIKSLIQQDSE